MLAHVSVFLVVTVLGAASAPEVTAESLFVEPHLTCRLQEFMGLSAYQRLKDSMQLVQEEGDVLTGGVRGLFTIMEGIVVPGDPPAAAFLADGEVWIYAESAEEPPEIQAWRMARAADARPIRKKAAHWQAPACTRDAIARREAATACTKEVALFRGFEAAIVQGRAAKAWFQAEPTTCPAAGACAARTRAFVVSRDAVELSSNVKPLNGFFCARFRGSRAATVGWLPGSSLELTPLEPGHFEAVAPSAWLGRWAGDHAEIEITMGDSAEGQSSRSLHMKGAASAGAHTGEIDAPLRPDRDLMVVTQAPCRATLQLANNAVFIRDNGECGGIGVSFHGVLYKQSRLPAAKY